MYIMSKMIISENRLQELINESIYEVLNESEFDEGFGHWLGQTYQGIKNRWNNFRKDIEAGRDKAQFDNKDYNAYSHFGDEENEIRKMRGQNVTNDTTETQSSSTTQNTDSTQSNDDQEPSANNGTIPHPSLVNTQQNQEQPQAQTPETPAQQNADAQNQPQVQSKRAEVESRFNNGDYPKKPESWVRTTEPSDAVYRKRMAIRNLKRAGIAPQNGNWNNPLGGWKNVNGGEVTKDQDEVIRTYSKHLFEEKLNELNKILNEIKTIRLKKK
jgi:hypothetical protein